MTESSEYASVAADLREYLAYMREMGVGYINADLSAAADVPRAGGFETAQIEKETIIRMPAPGKIVPPAAAAKAAKTGSRLGSLPTLSDRKILSKKTKGDTPETAAPLAIKQPLQQPDDGLFGGTADLSESADHSIDDVRHDIGNCVRCPLHTGRTKIVHTTGNFAAELMFVGEAPGADEDASGEPFVGRAGKLLTQIIESIGMQRQEVAIGNINRCRPPGNRQPTLAEAHVCRGFLHREIRLIKPRVIVVLGNTALHNLLDTKLGISKMRGQFHDYFDTKVMPTFHPAYLLRDPRKKREVWEDMKMVRDYLATFKDSGA